jgi:PAS domain S-box-containing protein
MSRPRHARILMVDDRPENLLALEAILEPLGQELVRAGSGEEALRALLRDNFAVILLDVQMPGMNGFETAEVVKQRERSRSTPIIFLTALSKEEQYVRQGYSAGAVDYMSKPIDPDVLRSKVAVFIELWLKNEELREKDRQLEEAKRRELEMTHLRRLSESEARYEDILGSVIDAVVTFGDDEQVVVFNAAAEAMFGRTSAAVRQRSVHELIAPGDRDDVATQVRALRRGARQEARSTLIRGVRADGTEFPLEISLSRLELRGGALTTMIGRDVTVRAEAEAALRRNTEELRAVNDELNRRTEALEDAMGARSRFYASMSHELRTPINAMLGYTALLLDDVYGPLKDVQVVGIERANRAAKHLLELVNDILDLSKIEAGKLEVSPEPVMMPGLIEDLFVSVQPLADLHGARLEMSHEGEPITLVTDARRVRQILLNLLSNAIKFGGAKKVTVESCAGEEGGIRIGVIDRGPGIPGADLERIFDEFVQLANGSRQEGTGLGLAISRRLANLLGGSLTVESVPTEGTAFWLTLPAALNHSPDDADSAEAVTVEEER